MKNFKSLEIFLYYIKALNLMNKFTSREELQEWQQKKLKKFFKKILSKSPFYKNYSYEDFYKIPVITKKEFLENFDSINTVGLKKEDVLKVAAEAENTRNFTPKVNGFTVGLSSGTSGQRGIFAASDKERHKWAGIMLAKTLGSQLWQPQKVALFLRSNSNLYESLNKGNHILFKYFDITYGVDIHTNKLNEFEPTIITAPSSILKHLATLKKLGKIQVKPEKIFSGAEVLEQEDQIYIEEIFQLPVRQIYQCTEGFLGITSLNGELCLNEEYVFIEKHYIDPEQTRFMPVITDFTRTTLPIVRYRLDDILIEEKNSRLPFISLKKIEGRADDVFLFRALNNKLIPIYPEILRQIMVNSKIEYSEYQLIQKDEKNIDLKIAPNLSQEDLIRFQDIFDTLCKKFELKKITVNPMPYTHFTNGEKLRRIFRLYKPEETGEK